MPRTSSTNRLKIRNISQVANFNGTSNFIDLGTSGPIAAATPTFSASCYFKNEKLVGLVAMIGDNNNAAQNHWNFQLQGAGRKLLTTVVTSTSSKALVGTANIPFYQWSHAVLVYDGVNITWYFNGLFDNSTTHTGTVLASTAGVLLGTGSAPIAGAYRYLGGKMAEVKYWNRALSAQEVADLYFDNRNDAAMRVGLQGEWLLSGDALDSSGNGNNGTITGATFVNDDAPLRDRAVTSGRLVSSGRGVIS